MSEPLDDVAVAGDRWSSAVVGEQQMGHFSFLNMHE